MTEEIRNTILVAIPDAQIHLVDPDGQHFEAIVISPSFNGVPLIKQHRMVMNPLKEAFATTVHALALKTFTPEKWETARGRFNL